MKQISPFEASLDYQTLMPRLRLYLERHKFLLKELSHFLCSTTFQVISFMYRFAIFANKVTFFLHRYI